MTEITNVRIKSNVHDACTRERDELRAENERLRSVPHYKVGYMECVDQLAKAHAEVERLRAALLKIADDSAHADQYVRWAQEVLDANQT